MNEQSTFFDSEGYLPLKAYIENISDMQRNGPWRLPLKRGDRFHLLLLSLFSKISWFADQVYVLHTTPFSPAYSILLSYLKKHEIYDDIQGPSTSRGSFSFLLQKKKKINGQISALHAQGLSPDKSTALSVAVGEMLERTITGLYDENKKVIYSSAKSLLQKKTSVVYPPLFHRFLDIQKEKFPVLRDSSDTSIAWVKGKNIVTGSDAYIPKKLTSWFTERQHDTGVLTHATTNGSAGYFSKEEALLRGMLEVIQRDGFLVHWLTMTPPQVVEINSLPTELSKELEKFKEEGIEVYLLNITSLGIPNVAVLGIGKSITGQPQVCVSAAAALSFREAIESATRELSIVLGMLNYTKDFLELENMDKSVAPFTSNLDKIARQVYWRGEDKVVKLDWFLSGTKVEYVTLSKSDLPHDGTTESKINACTTALKTFGPAYHPIVYYPVNKIQDEVGFYIAQVFIPKAFPFYLFERYGTFDSDRLYDFIAIHGKHHFSLNPEPHMFS